MGDALLNFDLTSYYQTLLWATIISTVVIVLFIIGRMIYKKNAKKKEKDEMNKYMEELFIKYSDVIADKVIEKINNKPKDKDVL